MNDVAKPVSNAPGTNIPSFSVTVRRAMRDDAALLHEVAAAAFPLACPPSTAPEAIVDFIATQLSEQRFTEYLADPSRDLFLALVDGTPAGYTMLITAEPSDEDVAAVVTAHPAAELSKVYVREGHHGSGIAGALVSATLDRARERGAVVVWLGVNDENVRANRFYEKQGFARVGTKRFKLGDRYENDFVLAQELQ